MTGRRVLVTGVDHPLGRRIAQRIVAADATDAVIGAARRAGSRIDGVEVIGPAAGYAGIAAVLRDRAIDTIIHASRPWARSASGDSAHIIATMQLAAAAAHRAGAVRRFVMVSSTRVYPASSDAPLLHSASERLGPRRGSTASSLVEAEGFVRDLAVANPNLTATVLRLADLVGVGTDDPLAVLLTSRVVPAAWGFDPHVQLLHVDDAAAAVEHAASHELTGFYNVAGDGLVRWREAARLAGKPVIDLPFAPPTLLRAAVARLYGLEGADDIIDVLRFGRGADTDAMARTRFRPKFTTEACARSAERADNTSRNTLLRLPRRSSSPTNRAR